MTWTVSFGALVDVQHRAGDGAVVGEHAQHVAAEMLGDGRDAEVDVIAVAEPERARGHDLRQTFGVARKEVVGHRSQRFVSCAAASSSSAAKSSGIGISRNALTSDPPVLPTG